MRLIAIKYFNGLTVLVIFNVGMGFLLILYDYYFGGVVNKRSPFYYEVHTPPPPPLPLHGAWLMAQIRIE